MLLPACLTAGLAGCAKRQSTAPVVTEPHPVPDSPPSTLLALKWGYEHLDADFLGTLLADDFVFLFASYDSAGNAYRNAPWTRSDELIYGHHLCDGGTTSEPPADRLELEFTNTLVTLPSSRPGLDPRYHKEIRAEVIFRVWRTGAGYLECRGVNLIGFARGDVAAIPQELVDLGYAPDSTRWWIEHWVDETVGATAPAGFSARSTHPADAGSAWLVTWGMIRAMYR